MELMVKMLYGAFDRFVTQLIAMVTIWSLLQFKFDLFDLLTI